MLVFGVPVLIRNARGELISCCGVDVQPGEPCDPVGDSIQAILADHQFADGPQEL